MPENKRGYKIGMWSDEDVKSELVSDMKFPQLFWNENKIIIMQYTGFKDRHGKEVYEGDIVKAESSRKTIYKIEFKEICLPLGNINGWVLHHDPEEIEVIGNIYESPNLLS